MSETIPSLEAQRAQILRQIAELGDFRSGSISPTSGRCGKPTCHCHQPGQPPHGPNHRLTYKVNGKTVTESLFTPAHVRKAAQEIGEFRKFHQLIREFIAVNAQICRARPVHEQPSAQEKKRPRRSTGKSGKK